MVSIVRIQYGARIIMKISSQDQYVLHEYLRYQLQWDALQRLHPDYRNNHHSFLNNSHKYPNLQFEIDHKTGMHL